MNQGLRLLPIFRGLSRCLHRHPPAVQGYIHTIHPILLWYTLYPPSTYFRRQHPFSHTVLIHSLHVSNPSQYCGIHSTSIPSLLCTSSYLTRSIRDTPYKLLKHFISRTFCYFPFFSAHIIHHVSALHNAVGTITPSYRHICAFLQNPPSYRHFFAFVS